MADAKALRRFFINVFTSGRYVESEFGVSDSVIQYGLLNYMLIGGIIGIGATTAVLGRTWALSSRLICYFIICVSFVCFLLARTKTRLDLISFIYITALSLYSVLHTWDGKAHGSNFIYGFSIPLASILLLGMARGVIITVTVGVIIALQMLIPGLSKYHYYSDFALYIILGYFIVSSMMIAAELTRKIKDRKIEEQRTQLDELYRAKKELFSNLSHEMRTPLAVMSAYAQFAVEEIRENGADEQTLADLATISSEAKRLAEMADGTLKILLSESETPLDRRENAPVNVGELSTLIASLFEPAAKRSGLALTAAVGRDVPSVHGDAGALAQLLWNLLQNAVIHSQCKNIRLTVEAGGWDVERPDAARSGVARPGAACLEVTHPGVTITVTDDGCGVEPDVLPRIFERGVAKKGGSGLGLSICREIALRHGGDIAIRSGQGEGTTVTVTLRGIGGGE